MIPRSASLFATAPALAISMLALSALTGGAAHAQSRLEHMPGYDSWAAVSPNPGDLIESGAIRPVWSEDSRDFTYTHAGREYYFDVTRRRAHVIGRVTDTTPSPSMPDPAPGPIFARGRGADADVISPDGKKRAFSHDMNVWIAPVDKHGASVAVTTDGGPETRIRNGVGSYVYLEEFDVTSPVWWSPDSRKLAWMRYDETRVEDYFLQIDQTGTFSKIHTQAYPHPGRPNPVADLMVRDFDSGQTMRMDVREGETGDNAVGHYVWSARWSADGSELLTLRADRLQKTFDLAACSVTTGACRSVVREQRPQSWAQGDAPLFLKDGKRFIWKSERTDFANLYLYDLSGRLITPLTQHNYDVEKVLEVDEGRGEVWYLARSGDNHMKLQLHRVKLDGTGDVRVTDPAFHHTVYLSPDHRYLVDVAQTHDAAPMSRLLNRNGKVLSTIAKSDVSAAEDKGLRPAEMFTFMSADGRTPLQGMIQFPANFDPAKKYPALLSVYGGPSTNGASEAYQKPDELAQYGFVVVKLDARTAKGKGRVTLDEAYQQLGVVEIDDFAAGLRALRERPWFDADRVGVFGTSYGGFVSALLILRYPDVVQAAVANSPVTDFRLYDSAYTERFLGLPARSPEAYDNTSAIKRAGALHGDLMIYYGTADDNVHPKNALQLIAALQKAGKSFDVMVGPDRGHTSMDKKRMMEFFIERLVMERPDADAAGAGAGGASQSG
ncbi:MAG: DPP IV N-terminal domain-containing protein [Hyphomonadaceae bacterium]